DRRARGVHAAVDAPPLRPLLELRVAVGRDERARLFRRAAREHLFLQRNRREEVRIDGERRVDRLNRLVAIASVARRARAREARLKSWRAFPGIHELQTSKMSSSAAAEKQLTDRSIRRPSAPYCCSFLTIFAQVSLRETVRLKTTAVAVESGSTQK